MSPLIPIAVSLLPRLIGALRKPKAPANDMGNDLAALLQRVPQLQQMLDMQMQSASEGQALRSAMTNLSTRLLPRSAFGNVMPAATAPTPMAVPRTGGSPINRRPPSSF